MSLPKGSVLPAHKACVSAIVRDDGIMCLFRSPMGDETQKLMDVSVDDYCAWASGQLAVQDAFPSLSADDRELFLTGVVW